jgi:hypothetical protein
MNDRYNGEEGSRMEARERDRGSNLCRKGRMVNLR